MIEQAIRAVEQYRFSARWTTPLDHVERAFSIGIAIYSYDGEDADTLMKNAEIAMYRTKEQGQDNYQRYTPARDNFVPYVTVSSHGDDD